jgi:hypothetical protein
MNRMPALPLALVLALAAVQDDPEPGPPERPELLGVGVQRTLRLLSASTAEQPRRVNILFYGQSITAGDGWTRQVTEDLQRRFPHARLEARNLAISGFASQLLVRTTDYDVVPFYPDLVIFHVYGSHGDYEALIRKIRTRTTAEVLMQSDHATSWPEPRTSGNFWTEQKVWDDKMNYFLLPAIAEKYGCAFHPQRWEWARYLKDQGLEPKALLSDAVHLNARGHRLMARLVSRYLVHRPDLPVDPAKDPVRVVKPVWRDGALRVEFDGNRVEAVPGPGVAGEADVLVDGRAPSAFPGCYTITRPTTAPGGWFPSIKHVSWTATPVVETWTARIGGAAPGGKDFTFELRGSVTGPDGAGRGGERFASRSGRVVVEPGDWSFDYAWNVSRKAVPEGFEVSWKVVPLGADRISVEPDADPAPPPVLLASDLPPGKHVLELKALKGRPPPIRELRLYSPPIR